MARARLAETHMTSHYTQSQTLILIGAEELASLAARQRGR